MILRALMVSLFMMVLSNSTFAQYFPASYHVNYLPGQVMARVYNPYYEPIICNGQVFGQTASGHILSTFFHEQFMPAGSFRLAYVNTVAFNPFVGSWASLHCRFARFW